MKSVVYLPSRFLPNLETGQIRLTTPDECKKADGIVGGHSDHLDMTALFKLSPGEHLITDEHPLIAYTGLRIPLGKTVRLRTGPETQFICERTAYIFCMARQDSAEKRNLMKERFGHDAVYTINDVEQFAGCVKKAGSLGDFLIRPMIYGDRPTPAEGRRDDVPFFYKRPEYSWQQEIRIAWSTSDVVGRIVHAPEIQTLIGNPELF